MPVQNRYSQFQSDQRRFFDELITEDWETYRSEDWDYTRTFEIQQLFKRVKPARILDVGCGVGFHDAIMAEYPFVERVDAFDYSEQSVLRANKEYSHAKINRFVADFKSFKAERPYDMVASFQVFEHLTEPEEYLSFSAESCRQGGVVAICTPNRLRWDNRVRASRNQPLILIDVMHDREYTAREIFEMGGKFGLKPAGWFGHSLYISSSWGSAQSAKWSYQTRTKLGYYLPQFAHIICVLMRKA
jgi:2-polyprenyl-3-methyl-5-hydroxy-6-metoxy-1,4-benzoquinol methylase